MNGPEKLKAPKVSVVMITYNHEKFIAQAIESVLLQKTSFPIEFVIGEDCSTDGTRGIVQEYAAKYPDTIRASLPARNMGMMRNFLSVLHACQGEYIACLEGDDLWTTPDKLETQINFLDQHPDCVLCHHRVVYFKNSVENMISEFPPPEKRVERVAGRMLAHGNFIQTCSLVFRKSALPPLGEDFCNLKLGDLPLCVLLAQRGWIGYIDRSMAAYRLHDTGVWSGRSEEYRNLATAEMVRFLVKTLDKNNRGPWAALLLENDSVELVKQSRSAPLLVIATAACRLLGKGARLRLRRLPRLLYCVAKVFICVGRRRFAGVRD